MDEFLLLGLAGVLLFAVQWLVRWVRLWFADDGFYCSSDPWTPVCPQCSSIHPGLRNYTRCPDCGLGHLMPYFVVVK